MAQLKLIAFTEAVAGREAEFDAWYDDTHVPDLLSVRGVTGARRYKRVATLNGTDQGGHLAIYDVECDDPAAFLADLGELGQSGRMRMTDALDEKIGYAALFIEHGATAGG